MSAYIQDIGGGVCLNANPFIVNVTASPATDSTIIMMVGWNGTGTLAAGAVTDSRGNTWTRVAIVGETTGNRVTAQIWYTNQDVAPLQSGDTISCNMSAGNTTERGSFLVECAGQETFDVKATSSSTGTTSISSGTTAATAQATEIAWVLTVCGATQASWTKDSAYSLPTLDRFNTLSRGFLAEYKDLSATGTQNATGTIPTSATYASAIATFTVPSVAATVPRYPAINFQNPGVL